MTELAEWDSFYLIVGGAAGALIGLQFVVMTLIAERPQVQRSDVGATFATPTIIHFGAVLFVAAVLRLPFKTAGQLAFVIGVTGVLGVIYICRITWRMTAQDIYEPVFEDWLTHSVLPFAAYATLAIAHSIRLLRLLHRCLLSVLQHSCCCLPGSIMPGMQRPTMFLRSRRSKPPPVKRSRKNLIEPAASYG